MAKQYWLETTHLVNRNWLSIILRRLLAKGWNIETGIYSIFMSGVAFVLSARRNLKNSTPTFVGQYINFCKHSLTYFWRSLNFCAGCCAHPVCPFVQGCICTDVIIIKGIWKENGKSMLLVFRMVHKNKSQNFIVALTVEMQLLGFNFCPLFFYNTYNH